MWIRYASTGDDDGNLYFDILSTDDKNAVFKLSNRDKNPELLKKFLNRIGMQDKIMEIKDCAVDVCMVQSDANAIAEKLSWFLIKIDSLITLKK